MIDLKLLALTVLNYFAGLSLYKYLVIHCYLEGFGAFLAPFIWFGVIVTVLKTVSAISRDGKKSEHMETRQKVLPNIILLLINALFPIVALLRLEHYESLKIAI